MNASARPCIREGTIGDLPAILSLWTDLYDHQRAHGLQALLAADGFDRWVRGMSPVLGRFGCLFVAELNNVPVGFLAGRVKAPTPPFDPSPVGFVSEVFVTKSLRGTGVGRDLLGTARGWFVSVGCTRIELQVLIANKDAIAAYRRLGWTEELVQMVLPLTESSREL
jgi:GNAT superfamily N-acetyltransferase